MKIDINNLEKYESMNSKVKTKRVHRFTKKEEDVLKQRIKKEVHSNRQ